MPLCGYAPLAPLHGLLCGFALSGSCLTCQTWLRTHTYVAVSLRSCMAFGLSLIFECLFKESDVLQVFWLANRVLMFNQERHT